MREGQSLSIIEGVYSGGRHMERKGEFGKCKETGQRV